MMRIAIAVAFLSTFLLAPAFAGEECCPTAGPEHEKLWFFIGEWTGEENWTATESSPMSGKAQCTWDAHRTMAGMFVEMGYTTKMEQDFQYEGKAILGYDAAKKTYKMWWFDASGACNEPSIGTWNGSALVFDGAGECGGVAYKARYTYEIKGHNEFTFSMAMAAPTGEYVPMMTSTIHRVGGRLTTASAPKAHSSSAAAALAEDGAKPGCCKEGEAVTEATGEKK